MLAQRVEQGCSRVQVEVPHPTVEGERDAGGRRLADVRLYGGGYAYCTLPPSRVPSPAGAGTLITGSLD
jgi:hypothetical protein